jgi:hypothetical protein
MITSGRDERDECGAADKAENLARCESSYCQLPVFGQLADPVRAEATKHVRPGCQSLGRPVAACAAVGTTWEASKFGGLNIKEYLQPRKSLHGKSCSWVEAGSRPVALMGKADDTEEETGTCTPWDRRGMGPGIRRKILRDNVGNIPPAAGADSNLPRLLERRRGEPERMGA